MWKTTARKLRNLFSGRRTPRMSAMRRAMVGVESLEHRNLLTTYVWTGAGNGNWSDANDWIRGRANAS